MVTFPARESALKASLPSAGTVSTCRSPFERAVKRRVTPGGDWKRYARRAQCRRGGPADRSVTYDQGKRPWHRSSFSSWLPFSLD